LIESNLLGVNVGCGCEVFFKFVKEFDIELGVVGSGVWFLDKGGGGFLYIRGVDFFLYFLKILR